MLGYARIHDLGSIETAWPREPNYTCKSKHPVRANPNCTVRRRWEDPHRAAAETAGRTQSDSVIDVRYSRALLTITIYVYDS